MVIFVQVELCGVDGAIAAASPCFLNDYDYRPVIGVCVWFSFLFALALVLLLVLFICLLSFYNLLENSIIVPECANHIYNKKELFIFVWNRMY